MSRNSTKNTATKKKTKKKTNPTLSIALVFFLWKVKQIECKKNAETDVRH